MSDQQQMDDTGKRLHFGEALAHRTAFLPPAKQLAVALAFATAVLDRIPIEAQRECAIALCDGIMQSLAGEIAKS